MAAVLYRRMAAGEIDTVAAFDALTGLPFLPVAAGGLLCAA
jgi:hypothetical protein